ncbi:YncE family protein [Pontibacter vulgaris]|uniref:YncE family protein n=1 Tax=Pontibacter vulgaris TaxID=2905679 RepID=UPI001FA79B55|nr:YncE family protein [Pontibacter vulgaris]
MKKYNPVRSFMWVAALAALTISGCNTNSDDAPTGEYAQDAVLISNEGAFNKSNASVSYYNRSTGQVQNEIYSAANPSQVLGDVLQSINLHNDKAYLVMNNSKKITVVNASTFKAEGEINGLDAPRYFAALNNEKGYVTEWLAYDPNTYQYGKGRVSVIDLKTYTVLKTIEVGVQPEQLVITGGKVYVANVGENAVTVINTITDAVEKNIIVTQSPNSLALDQNSNLWVISTGQKDWQLDPSNYTPGALTKINTGSNTVEATLPFSSKTAFASKLATNGAKNKLYFEYDNKVYQQDINATTLSTTPVINRSFSSLGIDPVNNYIYAGVAPGYTSNGWVVRFNPTGAALDSFRVGIAPNGFIFR